MVSEKVASGNSRLFISEHLINKKFPLLSRITGIHINYKFYLYSCNPYVNIAFYRFRIWTGSMCLIGNRLRFF